MYRSLAVLVLMVLAGCSGSTVAPSVLPTQTASEEPSGAHATESATEVPATPQSPAPAELIGRWRTVIGPGDTPILTTDQTRYTISGFDTGSGGIAVHGDEIDFLASNLCNGVGHYRSSIDGDELRLEPIGPDECPGRALALWERTYNRPQ